ncbi:MAG: methyl-accepting chemotaxis protein [Chloroflexota bacterium]
MMRWLRGLPVSNKILLGYSASLVLMVILGALLFRGLEQSLEANHLARHSQYVLRSADDILRDLADMETGVRGFVITGDEAFLDPYNKGAAALGPLLTSTLNLVSDNPGQTQRMQRIASAARDFQRLRLVPILQARRRSAAEATALVKAGQGKAEFDQIRAQVDAFTAVEQGLLTSRTQLNDDANRQLQAIIVGGTILAALLGLLGAAATARSIARRVNAVKGAALAVSEGDLAQVVPALDGGDEVDALGRAFNAMTRGLREAEATKVQKEALEAVLEAGQAASNNLASTASEILASVTQQGASTTQQASAISETTATVDEVRMTAEQANQRAQAVAEKARQAADIAAQGLETVDTVTAGMADIRARVETIAEQVLALSEQTQQVGEIIATVEDLADQSNLLAVNAAIEASRAGEQGRGFAVVAQEVRSLAERSKGATIQVRTILTEIQRATNAAVLATEQGTKRAEEGSKLVEQAGRAIAQLDETIRESAGAAQQIVASTGQVGTGMDQIAAAMTSINQATTETAAGTKQLHRAAENVNELSHRLVDLVGRYRLNGQS